MEVKTKKKKNGEKKAFSHNGRVRKYFSLFDEKSHCSKGTYTLMFTLNFPCYGSVIFVRIVHIHMYLYIPYPEPTTFSIPSLLDDGTVAQPKNHSSFVLQHYFFQLKRINLWCVTNKTIGNWCVGGFTCLVMFVKIFLFSSFFFCCVGLYSLHIVSTKTRTVYNACFVWNYKEYNSVISDTILSTKVEGELGSV